MAKPHTRVHLTRSEPFKINVKYGYHFQAHPLKSKSHEEINVIIGYQEGRGERTLSNNQYSPASSSSSFSPPSSLFYSILSPSMTRSNFTSLFFWQSISVKLKRVKCSFIHSLTSDEVSYTHTTYVGSTVAPLWMGSGQISLESDSGSHPYLSEIGQTPWHKGAIQFFICGPL